MATRNTPDSSDVRDGILAVGQAIMASKGFSGVGINEILVAAGVPKGSFYHYFGSKDAFGEALLQSYFAQYHAEMDQTLESGKGSHAQRLMVYFTNWRSTQSLQDCQGKCLAVKLGAEVADLSDAMRGAMKLGTDGIVARLAQALQAGQAEGSLTLTGSPAEVAASLYQLWLGASVLAKVARDTEPFDVALTTTRQLLNIPG